MKKILVFAVILGLLVPAAAFAATEFSLGGFIKLDSFWDSTQVGKNLNAVAPRNNDPNNQHGQMRFTAQGSRFNFTIKGPKVFGAQTTGFIEMDFDAVNGPDSTSASSVYTPRMRHAMFRFNWPATELLLGQYWSFFCSWYAEAAQDGPMQVTGTPTARIPQIRLTQKFLTDWEVSGLVGNANSVLFFGTAAPLAAVTNNPYSANSNNGMAAETPQIQGSLKYSHDWWGKAAYYGKPIPFTAQVMAGWQRSIVRRQAVVGATLDGGNAVAGQISSNNYLNPWMVMGSLFIPVIPTHSANLAGTAHILTQWWIGQGVTAFGFNGDATGIFKFNNNFFSTNWFDVELVKRWGGMVEGQYYFTNEWFLNVAYGLTRTLGIDQSRSGATGFQNNIYNGVTAGAFNGATNTLAQPSTYQEIHATLWYRPVQAIKFGLQYSYAQTNYLTSAYWSAAAAVKSGNQTRIGNEHRVEFVGYFFF